MELGNHWITVIGFEKREEENFGRGFDAASDGKVNPSGDGQMSVIFIFFTRSLTRWVH